MTQDVSAAEWLSITYSTSGAKKALSALLGSDLPTGCNDEVAKVIVDQMINGPRLLRWDLMSWWQARPRPKLKAEDLNNLFKPQLAKLPPANAQALGFKLPLGTRRAGLEAARAAFITAAGSKLANPYLAYFAKTGVLDAILPTSFESDWVPTFTAALSTLEAFWQAGIDGTSDYQSKLDACVAHFNRDIAGQRFAAGWGSTTLGKAGVDLATVRRIWARRLAVALWSDAHHHWPWRLSSLAARDQRTLLMFSAGPQITGVNWTDQLWTYQAAVAERPGQDLHIYGDSTYGTGNLWNPDPFLEWRTCWFEVGPLGLGGSRRDGLYAVTRWVRQRGMLHDDGVPPAAAQLSPHAMDTVPDLLQANRAGCTTNAPLVAGLLRAMNVPAVVVLVAIYKREDMVLTTTVDVGHYSVVCPSPDAALALIHGDYELAFRGQRFSDEVLTWLPLGEWLLLNLVGISSVPHGDIGSVLTDWIGRVATDGIATTAVRGVSQFNADILSGGTRWFDRVRALLDGTFDKLRWNAEMEAEFGPADWLGDLLNLTDGNPGSSPTAWRASAQEVLLAVVFSPTPHPKRPLVDRLAKSYLARADRLGTGVGPDPDSNATAWSALPQQWVLPDGTKLSESLAVSILILAFGVDFRVALL